jgi:hypothetical protein
MRFFNSYYRNSYSVNQPSAFPNPTSNLITLQFPVFDHEGKLEVYDVVGKVVYKEIVSAWSQYKDIELSAIGYGIYYCRMLWGNSEGIIKIVKTD